MVTSLIEKLYIADGHHRFETYSSLAEESKGNGVDHSDYFPVILFPRKNLNVFHYNRLIHSVKGKSVYEIL